MSHSHSSWEESFSCADVITTCTCIRTRVLSPPPRARTPQNQLLPPLPHGQEASTFVVLLPSGTFTHALPPVEPHSSFHSCFLLLSGGHAGVATAYLHLTAPWAAISSPPISRPGPSSRALPPFPLAKYFLPWATFLFYHFLPSNYFSIIIYQSNIFTQTPYKITSTDLNIYWLLWLWPINTRMLKWWEKAGRVRNTKGRWQERHENTLSEREWNDRN